MKRNKVLRTSALAAALYVAAIAGVQAQSTTGSIAGSVGEGAGKTVLVTNNSGFSREVPVDASGHYAIGNLPLGTYKVAVKSGGSEVESRDDIAVIVGRSTDVSFGGGGATTLAGVSITGSRVSPIDVTSTDTRTVVTSEQLQQLPLGRSAEAIALLAPGVVTNSGGFKGSGGLGAPLVSFGGSSASENAYYLNGFNTTDPTSALGGLTLPYGAISQQEIFTGGYGAQYGRSNGGVINQVGKSGSNDWHFGVSVIWEPNGLKQSQNDLYWRDDSIYQPLSKTSATSTTYSGYIGGPIIKDKLFFFLAAEQEKDTGTRVATTRDAAEPWVNYDYKQTRAYAKIDWHITDNHLIELTGAENKADVNGSIYSYDYATETVGGYLRNEGENKYGPELWSGKYTGFFGDNITVTALYGEEKIPNKLTPYNYDPSLDYVVANTTTNPQNPAYLPNGQPITNSQTGTPLSSPDREYKKNNLRLNLNWKIGDHSLDFGIDNQVLKGIDVGSYLPGPDVASWQYDYITDPVNGVITTAHNDEGGSGVTAPAVADPTYGSSGYYVEKDVNTTLYNNKVEQKGYYVSDHWQISENFLLDLGLRNDKAVSYVPNTSTPFIDTDNEWAPRIGFSWDVHGDSSLKVYGNLGRYYLNLPSSSFAGLVAGGAAISTQTFYTYKGINPDGTPIISTQLGAPVSANSVFGHSDVNVVTASAKGLKGANQDELILGFSKQLQSGWVAGVRGTVRRLNDDIDDVNVDSSNSGLVNAAIAAGLTLQNGSYWDTNKTYGSAAINPGETNVYRVVGWDGQVHDLTVTRQQQGFPELKRSYAALEFTAERPFDGTWYANLSYTWAHSYGTTEGQLRSDLWRTNTSLGPGAGDYGGQTAVSTTQSWDQAALMENFNGDQSNDHRHAIKLFGYYQLAKEWGVSSNLALISGAPINCEGYYYGNVDYSNPAYNPPSPYDPAGYANPNVTGGTYHFCYDPETGTVSASPPGSHGHLGWLAQVDFGLTYKPDFAGGKLAFNLNVFNITNNQTITARYPFSELGYPTVDPNTGDVTHYTNPLYNQPVAYQTPRYARLTVSYDY